MLCTAGGRGLVFVASLADQFLGFPLGLNSAADWVSCINGAHGAHIAHVSLDFAVRIGFVCENAGPLADDCDRVDMPLDSRLLRQHLFVRHGIWHFWSSLVEHAVAVGFAQLAATIDAMCCSWTVQSHHLIPLANSRGHLGVGFWLLLHEPFVALDRGRVGQLSCPTRPRPI